MAKKLTRTVFVDGVAYGPASTVPDDVAKRITNPKVWADADAPAPAPAGLVADASSAAAAERAADDPPSPEWTVRELKDFAKARGIALGEARAKDQILATLAEAGHGADPAADGDQDDDESATGAADEAPEADSPEDVDETAGTDTE